MRKLSLVVLSTSLLMGGYAHAGVLHGLSAGINLIYNGGANPLSLTMGYGQVDGLEFQLPIQSFFTPTLTVGSSPLVKSTAYYCYVVLGDKNVPGTPFTDKLPPPLDRIFSFACSTTGPNANGHPSGLLTGPNGSDGTPIFKATTSALFVGSVLTDPGAATFIPFYRNGQQVLLDLQTTPAPVEPTPPAGYNKETPYDPGVGGPTFLTFKAADMFPETLNFTPSPFPLASASAAVLDVHAYNYSVAGIRICALDPNNRVIIVANAIATQACQGQSYVNPSLRGTDPSIHTYRANLNFDSTGKIYFGLAFAPGNEVVLGAVYRGYLEPIKQLFALYKP
jgi:hypothetical protein